MADSEEVEKVLEAIADAGFEPEPQETAESGSRRSRRQDAEDRATRRGDGPDG
jgi:predicted neutral ceramidase superfamily lipid hydrolase